MQVLKQVYAERGQQIEQVVVPFTDGIDATVPVNPLQKKAIDNKWSRSN